LQNSHSDDSDGNTDSNHFSDAEPISDFEDLLEENNAYEKSAPLCPCTDVTVDDLYVRVLTLGLRHGLTWVAQEDILKVVASIFKKFEIPATKNHYWKRLEIKQTGKKRKGNSNNKVTKHLFCNKCECFLGQVKSGHDETV